MLKEGDAVEYMRRCWDAVPYYYNLEDIVGHLVQ